MPGPGPAGYPGPFPFFSPSATLADTPIQVGAVLSSSWRIRATVGVAIATSWRIRNAVGLALSGNWRIRAAVGVARSLAWSIRAAVGVARTASWRIRAAVGSADGLSWRIRAAVGATRALAWPIRAAVGTASVLPWVIVNYIHVGAAVALGWRVFGQSLLPGGRRARTAAVVAPPLVAVRVEPRDLVRAELPLGWALAGGIGADFELGWQIHDAKGVPLRAAWRLDDFWSANREVLLAEIDEDLLVLTH